MLVFEVSLRARCGGDHKEFQCQEASFLQAWNGVGMMLGVVPMYPAGTITSDASGSWGCGAFTSAGERFQLKLPGSWHGIHITAKEVLPIVIGVALWGEQWRGQTVVAVIRSGSNRDERVMHLMRSPTYLRGRKQGSRCSVEE